MVAQENVVVRRKPLPVLQDAHDLVRRLIHQFGQLSGAKEDVERRCPAHSVEHLVCREVLTAEHKRRRVRVGSCMNKKYVFMLVLRSGHRNSEVYTRHLSRPTSPYNILRPRPERRWRDRETLRMPRRKHAQGTLTSTLQVPPLSAGPSAP